MFRSLIPVVFACLTLAPAGLRSQARQVDVRFQGKLQECHVPGLDEAVLCGQYATYENRAAGSGRQISLNIVVLPATGPKATDDPLVYLAGGGVLPATEYAGFFARQFSTLRRERDILLVDQRGTGASNPLRCDLGPPPDPQTRDAEASYLEALGRCRHALASVADLRFYTTALAMDDLDDIRAWLGYSKLNLYGMSYGTKAAQVYLRQHPSRVRVVAMHGVVPINTSMWSETPRLAQEAFDRLISLCNAQDDCRASFPNLRHEFDSLLQRLTVSPQRVEVQRPVDGVAVPVPVTAAGVREFTYNAMAAATAMRFLPVLVHAAYEGNYAPLAVRLLPPPPGRGVPRGVFLSIACPEAVALVDTSRIAIETANTFMGAASVWRLVRSCRDWPQQPLPTSFWSAVESNVPVLLLSGALDLTTPPRYAESVARSLRTSRQLVLPNRSHNDLDPCVAGIIEAFVVSGSLAQVDGACASSGPPLTFVTKLPGSS